MSILVKTAGERWAKASEEVFSNEVELQELLYASPELIEREDEGPVVFTRESSLPGSGSTDLIGVASNGDILLIETKLAKNAEIRRKVIGQIFEYAAFLWGMSFKDFDQMFQTREGKPLVELLVERGAEIEAEDFRAAVSENLEAGRFDLLIAVDEMNNELEKIIAYLSNFGSGLKLQALAVKVHKQGPISVLVPQRFGQLAGPRSGNQGRSKVTVEQVLAASPDDHTREMIQLLVTRWESMGHSIEPKTSGLSCRADVQNRAQPLFWLLPEGGAWCVEVLFSTIAGRGAPEQLIQRYREAVSQIEAFGREKALKKSRPTAKLSKLDSGAIERFIDSTEEFVKNWKAK